MREMWIVTVSKSALHAPPSSFAQASESPGQRSERRKSITETEKELARGEMDILMDKEKGNSNSSCCIPTPILSV